MDTQFDRLLVFKTKVFLGEHEVVDVHRPTARHNRKLKRFWSFQEVC